MLGNIAKKMRMLGFDTKYSANISDDEVLELARKDNRIIISRDEQLVMKSQKKE